MTHTIEVHDFTPTDPRLARHVTHDSRSWDSQFLGKNVKPKGASVFWNSSVGPLNQGKLGSCTGNASAQWFNSKFADKTRKAIADKAGDGKTPTLVNGFFNEDDAVGIYSMGTHLDGIRGLYPPTDTGCSGLGVAKACRHFGFITEYSHIFSFTSAQRAAELTPFIQGTVWTNNMFKPVNGLVTVGMLVNSNIAGGHEYQGAGIDHKEEVFIYRNSWGDQDDWPGSKPGGYFAIGFKDVQRLLAEQGDITVFHGIAMP